jgi:hypothetical protein
MKAQYLTSLNIFYLFLHEQNAHLEIDAKTSKLRTETSDSCMNPEEETWKEAFPSYCRDPHYSKMLKDLINKEKEVC